MPPADLLEEPRGGVGHRIGLAAIGLAVAGTRDRRAAEQHEVGIGGTQRAADHRHEGLAGARTGIVHEARERLAAGAGFAHEQHGCRRAGDLLQIGPQLLDQAALADRRDGCRSEQLASGAALAAGFERTLDGAQQLGERQRLFDEIEGAEPGRLDRRVDGAMTGHHHDRAAVAREG